MSKQTAAFDPYAILEALEAERVAYVVVGAFARVVHGSGETTRGIDVASSLRDDNLRRLARAFDQLRGPRARNVAPDQLATRERTEIRTVAGALAVVPTPWGTRGYDGLRIRSNRENLGQGLRPPIASLADCVRMLEASSRSLDHERLQRLRRMMELERQLTRGRSRGLSIER